MRYNQSAQVTLTTVLLIGGLTLAVGVSVAFLVISFINSTSGFQQSERALAAAQSGTQDAILRLLRNANFESLGGYGIQVGDYQVQVTVDKDNPSAGRTTITAYATAGGYERKLKTVAAVDAYTSEVTVVSSELSL